MPRFALLVPLSYQLSRRALSQHMGLTMAKTSARGQLRPWHHSGTAAPIPAQPGGRLLGISPWGRRQGGGSVLAACSGQLCLGKLSGGDEREANCWASLPSWPLPADSFISERAALSSCPARRGVNSTGSPPAAVPQTAPKWSQLGTVAPALRGLGWAAGPSWLCAGPAIATHQCGEARPKPGLVHVCLNLA